MKFKNNFFFSIISVKHTQNSHTSVVMDTELIHTCTVKLKKGSDSVEFLFIPLCFYTHKHTLLGLAYIDI